MRTVGLAIALCAAALGFSRARAHELWMEPAGDNLVVRAGHRGDELAPIGSSRIQTRCAQPGGKVATVDLSTPALARRGFAPDPEDQQLFMKGPCEAASAAVDQGFFVVTPDGEKRMKKSEAKDAVKSWRSRQFAKWVDVRAAGAAKPLGDALELVPVTDLAKARVGEKVTVRVLLEGRPAAGAVVSIGHERLAETSPSGEARIAVRHAGVETISASVARPLRTSDADSDVLEATLSFEVPR
jgi:nickel transport protein